MMTRPFSPDRLKKLSLSNTLVSDSGLQGLISLKELQELCLDRTAVTSRGVAALITHLPHLQVQKNFYILYKYIKKIFIYFMCVWLKIKC